MSAKYWKAIGPFTIEATAEAAIRTPYEERYLITPMAQFVAWQWMSGVLLDRAEMFTRDAVDTFIREQTKKMSKGSRANYRAVLRRVVEVFEVPKGAPSKRLALTAASPAAPYTAAEEAAWRVLMGNQATELRRENGEVLLALGFGAGLATEDIALLFGPHIVKVRKGIEIDVPGRRARVVPVLSEWEGILLAAAERVGDQRLFLPNRDGHTRNLVSNFVAKLSKEKPGLSVTRMRASWIVRLLNGGIKTNVLMTVAGVADPEALARYVQFMDPVPTEDAHATIRALSRAGG
ncbi:MAG: hypothetical protein LC749_01650 [Actinobacteria bacterium]|nr:hypothetical protein [Actinomycetota bacterium]